MNPRRCQLGLSRIIFAVSVLIGYFYKKEEIITLWPMPTKEYISVTVFYRGQTLAFVFSLLASIGVNASIGVKL